MKSWFQGLNVAVVGNALSLFDLSYGDDIDRHDVVCRINLGATVNCPRSHGTRTDVLIFSKYAFAKKTRVYHESMGGFKITHMMQMPNQRDPVPDVLIYPEEYKQALHIRMGLYKGQKPSTGAMLLDYLDHCDPATVDVYGFDWKQSPTFYNQRDIVEPHAYQVERMFCLEYLYAQRGFRFYG